MGDQRRKESPHVEEPQLQRDHHGVLEFLRCYLQVRSLDALGHAQLRKRATHADHGHGPWRIAVAVPECSHRNGIFEAMKAAAKKKKASGTNAGAAELLHERELRGIVDTVLRLAKSTEAEETEVHVDEVADALTRFANNGIHQNVAEHGLTISVRTVVDGRTARATTNRLDEDSIRSAIEASLSLARSQPKNPRLLPMPGKQHYRAVRRFIGRTAALTAEDRARAVRRACDLAVKKGQSELRRCACVRSTETRRASERKGASGRERARVAAWALHGDPRTRGSARSGGVSFLRFCRDRPGRQALLPE